MPSFATTSRRAAAAVVALLLGIAGALVIAPAAHAASFTVTSSADAGAGTLRQAIIDANSGLFPGSDTITFSPAVTTITLASTIVVTEGLVINGPGTSNLLVTRSGDIEMIEFNMASADQDVTIVGVSFDGGPGSNQRGLDFLDVFPVRNLVIANSEFAGFQTSARGGVANVEQLNGNLIINSTDFHDNVSPGNISPPGFYAEDVDTGFVSISDSSFSRHSGIAGAALMIMFSDAEISINECTFTDNQAVLGGGAAYFAFIGGVTVRDSTFTNNDSLSASGGALAVAISAGALAIEDSTFTGSDVAGAGGAVEVSSVGGLELIDTTFTDNGADVRGGAVSAAAVGETLIQGSTFSLNSSASTGGAIAFSGVNSFTEIAASSFTSNSVFGNGGAIWFDTINAEVEISRTTFAQNVATAGPGGASGGAIFAGEITSGSELVVDSSTFNDGFVDTGTFGTGGGVSIAVGATRTGGRLGVLNSTFYEDAQGTPGAIFVETAEVGSDLTVENTTLVANSGIRIGTNDGDAAVANSIIDGDILDLGRDSFRVDAGSGIAVRYSALSSALDATMIDNGGNQFAVADMQLGALASNGGITQTMVPAAASPVVNTGDPAFAQPPAVDQRGSGFVRVVSGRIDIGAIEVQAVAALAATGTDISPIVPIGAGALLFLGAALVLITRRRAAATR